MPAHRIRSAEVDLSVERIQEAARVIDPVFLHTPQYVDQQLCTALGREVVVKVETANPLRSFKGRGTDFLVRGLSGHLVCVSSGNFGQGLAYAARARGLTVDVLTPAGVNPLKLDRIRALGAAVIEIPGGVPEAKAAARARVADLPGAVLIEDGRHPEIAEGAGTIAVELLGSYRPDTIVVPVGDGALITGIARWVKEFAPSIRVVGVCATGAPSMLHSLRAGHPVPTDRADTIAEGIMISTPVPESVARLCALVDDIVLVDDAALVAAMRLALHTLGLVLEPSGAAGLAALMVHDLAGSLAATVLTGGNAHQAHLETLVNRTDPGGVLEHPAGSPTIRGCDPAGSTTPV